MKFSSAVLFLVSLVLTAQFAIAAELEFAYSGVAGPERWGLLSPENEVCENGKKQSPIDIPQSEFRVNRIRPVAQFKDASNLVATNNGHTVEISSADEKKPIPVKMKVKGRTFKMEQMHFHTPSEHRVDGKSYDAEMHLVFAPADKGPKSIAVLAVFYRVADQSDDFLQSITEKVPQAVDEKQPIKQLRFSNLLKSLDNLKEVYNYEGSLTTPPCTEGVQFFISRKIQSIDVTQLLSLRNAMGFNARPVQFRDFKVAKEKTIDVSLS